MIMKVYEYFIARLNYEEVNDYTKILNEEELKLFNLMNKYDKLHSINVYKGISKTNLDKKYLKLALLHDIGKEKAGFIIRVLHKIGFKTRLRNHALNGYNLVKDIDLEVANLILIHHNKDVDDNMKIFQGVDDVN